MNRPVYDHWLFDLDGTLVDTDPDYISELFGRVGDRLGYGFTEDEAAALWHGLGGAPNDRLRGWGVEPEAFWTAFHAEEDPIARAEATVLYDDAAFVGELDAPVGLVTHCQDYLTGPVLDHVGIRDWFDAVVCCSDEFGWKPDPAPVRRALRGLGATKPEAAVLAGDSPHDVGAAWNAGLDGIHVERHGPGVRGQCVLGDHRIRSFDELRHVPAALD